MLCVVFGVKAQVVTVTDIETDDPMAMVTLASNSPKTHTTTNMNGQADVGAFLGADTIQVRMLGYHILNMSYNELKAAGFKIEMVRSGLSLDQFIVTANRWVQPKLDVPGKVSTISARDVNLQNPQTAADLLGVSGEVFIQKSQSGGGSPMIRGFATNRLLITVDGVRMNTAIFRSGNVQNVISLDPFATANTEVFFGPGSVMYGSDAIGGVMSFQTISPTLALDSSMYIGGKILSRFSSANNEITNHIDLSFGSKKFGSTTSFSFFMFDHVKMGSNGPDDYLRPWYSFTDQGVDTILNNSDPEVQYPSDYNQVNFMQKLRFKPNENWNLEYGFHYSQTSNVPRYDRLIRLNDTLPRHAEWYYGPQMWMMNNLTITHLGDSVFYDELNIRLTRQDFEESRNDRNYGDSLFHNRIENVIAYSANIDLTKRITTRTHLFYGAEFVMNDVTSSATVVDIGPNTGVPGPSRYPNSTWTSIGAYFTHQLKLTEKITIQTGARYNQFIIDATFDTTFYPLPFTSAKLNTGALTGSFGAVFNPNEKWSISVHGATGFRSPNIDDMGKIFDSEPGMVVVPNPDLKAEYAYNAELDVAKLIGDHIKVDAVGYFTYLDNALVRRDYQLDGQDSIIYDGQLSQVQAIQNASVAKVYGVQVGVDLDLPSGFGMSSKFNFQKGEETLSDGTTTPSRHAPPAFGTVHLTWTTKKLSLDLYTIYTVERPHDEMPEDEKNKDYIYALDANGDPYAPAWYTLNFKAMYKVTDNFAINAGIENITDQRYRPYSSGITAPGINFIGSAKISF